MNSILKLMIKISDNTFPSQVESLVDVPEEICDLNPQKICKFGTRLVPSLKPKHECTVFPKETCQLKLSTPRIEKKPLRSEWCLDDSPVVSDETYDEAQAIGSLLSARNSRQAKVFKRHLSQKSLFKDYGSPLFGKFVPK